MAHDDDVFDAPALMRLGVVDRLGLDGEDRVAGLVTGAGYPEALEPIISALHGAGGGVVDVGAGLGGAAAYVARAAGVAVVGVEPEARVVRKASEAFPGRPMVVGTATALPIADDGVAAVTLLGAMSLLADLDAAIAEAARVTERGGSIALTDLCLAEAADELRSGPNVFRSPTAITTVLRRHGYRDVAVSRRPADAPTRWDEVTNTVDEAVDARYGETEAGQAWRHDRQRLRGLIEAGRLLVATITARWSPTALTVEERALLAAGGEPIERENGTGVDIQGPNSA